MKLQLEETQAVLVYGSSPEMVFALRKEGIILWVDWTSD